MALVQMREAGTEQGDVRVEVVRKKCLDSEPHFEGKTKKIFWWAGKGKRGFKDDINIFWPE